MGKEIIPKETLLEQEKQLSRPDNAYQNDNFIKAIDWIGEKLIKLEQKEDSIKESVSSVLKKFDSILFKIDELKPEQQEESRDGLVDVAEEASGELKEMIDDIYPLNEQLNNCLAEKSQEEIEEIFVEFNKRFQMEIYLSPLTINLPFGKEFKVIPLERIFNDIQIVDQMLERACSKDGKAVEHRPKLGLELLLNEDLDIDEIRSLEKKYGINITSVHWRMQAMGGGLPGQISNRILKEFQKDNNSEKMKDLALELNVPVTVHSEELEGLAKAGLLKDLDVRVENMTYSKDLAEEDLKYCDPEYVKGLAEKCGFRVNFDAQHFQTYQRFLQQRNKLSKEGIDLSKDKNSFFNKVLEKIKGLTTKFHLSAGRGHGKGLDERHLSLLIDGDFNFDEFLQKYGFSEEERNFISLELNMAEKGT